MENNRNVRALKAALNAFEKNQQCELKNVIGRCQEQAEIVRQLMQDSHIRTFFENKDDDDKRKLHLLLFVNTELQIKSALESDCSVGHVVGAIPQLSSHLYFSFTHKYNMIEYMLEVMEQGPIMVLLALIDIIDSEVKLLPSSDYFKFLTYALQAITVRLMQGDKCFYIAKTLVERFEMLMLHYKNPEDTNEEDTKKSKEYITDEGYKFMSLTCFFRQITEIIYGEAWVRNVLPIYKIEIPFDSPEEDNSTIPEDVKQKLLTQCYECVFFKYRALVTELDLHMFLTWHEIVLNKRTLQNIIGEEVFYLCHLLKRKQRRHQLPEGVPHLLTMLESITVKPDKANVDSHDNIAQIEELVMKKDTIIDKELLMILQIFLEQNHFKPEVSVTLVRKLFDEKMRPSIDIKCVKQLIVKLLQELDMKDLLTLQGELIAMHGLNNFMADSEEAHRLVRTPMEVYIVNSTRKYLTESEKSNDVEYFNETEDKRYREAALAAFHATPADLLLTIEEGCTEKTDAASVIPILEIVKPMCMYKSEVGSHTLLVELLRQYMQNTFKNVQAKYETQFIELVMTIIDKDLIHVGDFLNVALLPMMRVNEETDWPVLAVLLKLFREIVALTHTLKGLCWGKVLVQLAQILDMSRCTFTTFTSEKLVACERAVDAIEIALDVYLEEMNNGASNWMVNILNTASILTRSYFTRIDSSIGCFSLEGKLASLVHTAPESYVEFVKEYSKNENLFVIRMGQLLAGCTQRELRQIIQNYAQGDCDRLCFILDLVSEGISLISNAGWQYSIIQTESSNSIFHCIGHLINNFLTILQSNTISSSMVDQKVNYARYINRIIIILKLFPENIMRTYHFNMAKFLMEELDKLKENAQDFDNGARQLLVGLYLM